MEKVSRQMRRRALKEGLDARLVEFGKRLDALDGPPPQGGFARLEAAMRELVTLLIRSGVVRINKEGALEPVPHGPQGAQRSQGGIIVPPGAA
jgi:hypothetical protein